MLSKDNVWSPSLMMSSAAGQGPRQGGPGTNGNASGGYNYSIGSSSSMGLQGNGSITSGIGTHDRAQELCKYFTNGGCVRGSQCPYLHELPDERHLDVNGVGYIFNANVHNAQKTMPSTTPNSLNSPSNQVHAVSASSPLIGIPAAAAQPTRTFSPFTKAKGQPQFMVGMATHLPPTSGPLNRGIQPKYRPPEASLEFDLPPALALPFQIPENEVADSLTASLLRT